MRVTLYRDRRAEWRWQLKGGNGKIIGASSEGYRRRGAMLLNLFAVTRIRVTDGWKRWPLRYYPLTLHVRITGNAEMAREARIGA